MRIISLVPNATEILFALGVGDLVVGVSHECDFPPAAASRPQLTASALEGDLSDRAIDRAVAAQLAAGESLYTLDEERIADLAPNLIVTQTLCPVCAVSAAQVESATAPMQACPRVVSLDPKTLENVFEDILRLGTAVGRTTAAQSLVGRLGARLETVRRSVAGRKRPRVTALEWLDPPFVAGHWIPEMIEIAGGIDTFARPGEASRRVTWPVVLDADPDVVVAMPCGYDRDGAAGQVQTLSGSPEWSQLRAVAEGRVHSVDANGCFSRPGPRLVDGIEELAHHFHGS